MQLLRETMGSENRTVRRRALEPDIENDYGRIKLQVDRSIKLRIQRQLQCPASHNPNA